MVAGSVLWLFQHNGRPAAINADNIASPSVLSFSDTDNYNRALYLLQNTLQLRPLALETIPIPFTDFTKISLLSYEQAQRRLIQGDPRRTSYFEELAVFFSAKGDTGRLIYLSDEDTTKLDFIIEQLSAAGIQFLYTSDNNHESKNNWLVILFFILILTLTQEKSRKQLYRLLVYIPWLLVPVFNDSIIAALLSLACIYAAHNLTKLLPYIRSSHPKPAITLSTITSVLTHLGPVSLVIILFIVLDRSLLGWLLVSMLISGLVFRFRNQLYQADNFYHYHKIPVFKPIFPTRTLKAGSAFYIYLLFTVMFLAALSIPAAGLNKSNPSDFSDTEILHVSSFSDLQELLLKHLFVQNALTEGIIGTYDPGQRVYNVHFTNYMDSRPSGIAIQKKEYSNSISSLEAQLIQLDSIAFMPFQTLVPDLAIHQADNGQIKQVKVLDIHTYLVSIIALALFFGHGILSRLLHVRMLSYMEQPD